MITTLAGRNKVSNGVSLECGALAPLWSKSGALQSGHDFEQSANKLAHSKEAPKLSNRFVVSPSTFGYDCVRYPRICNPGQFN
jgi:hypothetical protein